MGAEPRGGAEWGPRAVKTGAAGENGSGALFARYQRSAHAPSCCTNVCKGCQPPHHPTPEGKHAHGPDPASPDSPRPPERLDMDSAALERPPLLMPLPWERVRASTAEEREAMVEERRMLSWRRPDSFHTCRQVRGRLWW